MANSISKPFKDSKVVEGQVQPAMYLHTPVILVGVPAPVLGSGLSSLIRSSRSVDKVDQEYAW